MVRKSLFITLEGGEGAGKSTLLQKLKEALFKEGLEVLTTREPGGTVFGEKIREWLLHHDEIMSISSQAELLLFLSARAQHIQEVILPALQAGMVVICDRFNDSTIAYQGKARGLGMDYVEELCKLTCKDALPNLTFLLDIDPVIGLERTKNTNKESAKEGCTDKIESEALHFHESVRKAMHEIAAKEPERVKILDANNSKEELCNKAVAVILNTLNQKRLHV